MKIENIYVITLDMSESYIKEKTKMIHSAFGASANIIFHLGTKPKDNAHCKSILVEKNFSVYGGWKIDIDNKWWNRGLLVGEIGCFISHFEVWQQISEKGLDNTLVLEQDFHIKKPYKEMMAAIDRNDISYDILYLGRNMIHEDVGILNEDIVIPGFSYNTHAYILSNTGASKLLSHNPQDNIIPVDEFISAVISKHPREDIYNLYENNFLGFSFKTEYIRQINTNSAIENTEVYNENTLDLEEKRRFSKKDIAIDMIFIIHSSDLEQKENVYRTKNLLSSLGELISYSVSYEVFSDAYTMKQKYNNFTGNGLIIHIGNREYNTDYVRNMLTDISLYLTVNRTDTSYIFTDNSVVFSAEINENRDISKYDILNTTDINKWCDKYLTNAVRTKKWDLVVRDMGDEIFMLPVFNKLFCEELIDLANTLNRWTKDRHTFYPTTDVLLEFLDERMEIAYNYVLDNYIIPLANHIWQTEGKDWLDMHRENFMIKYEIDGQSHLDLHHDYADYTALLTLNTEFTGGGTYFNRQKKYVKSEVAGTITIHPATLTHKHGAMPIESGERYVVVSFIRRKIKN